MTRKPASSARAKHRAVRALSDATGLPRDRIRDLLERELARLELGAKVRTYLPVLAAANVRAALLRRLWQRRGSIESDMLDGTKIEAEQIERWETEGGSGAVVPW